MLRLIELWSTWNLSCPPSLKKSKSTPVEMKQKICLEFETNARNIFTGQKCFLWKYLACSCPCNAWVSVKSANSEKPRLIMLNFSLLPRWSILSWSFSICIRKRISKFGVCSVYLKDKCKLRCKIIVLYRCH